MKTRLPLTRLPVSERTARRSEIVSAWILHGDDVRQWLQACIELKLDQKKLRVFPVRLDGVEQAILLAGEQSSVHVTSVHAKPLHRIFDRLWIPYDAELVLPVFTEDMKNLISSDFALLFPDNKIVHFSMKNALKVVDFLSPPEKSGKSWDSGREGNILGFKLKSIHTLNPGSLDDFLDESQGDIGTQDVREIDTPGEGSSIFKKLFHKGKKGANVIPGSGVAKNIGKGIGIAGLGVVAVGLKGIGAGMGVIGNVLGGFSSGTNDKFDHSSDGPSLMDRLMRWTEKNLSHLKNSQSKAIDDLIDKLKNDPDLGLQFALPLNGQDGRGLANPGSSLMREKMNFDLSSIRAGGVFSPWDLGHDHYQQLVDLYRQNANREMTMGRHRRAAYIYANLLDDLSSAAGALEQGGYYQEAAALYNKLELSDQEADCWVKAGEIEKAVAIYERLNNYQEIADLYTQLGRHEEAAKVWRDYILKLLSDDDPLGATALMIEKFDEYDQAISCLADYWWHSSLASACLVQEMKYREVYQDAEQYEERMLVLLRPSQRAQVNEKLLIVFDSLRNGSAVPLYREWLSDGMKVLASSVLLDPRKTTHKALSCLKELEKNDELIHKDIERVKRLLRTKPKNIERVDDLALGQEIILDGEVWHLLDVLKTDAGFTIYYTTKTHIKVASVSIKDAGNTSIGYVSWECDNSLIMGGRLSCLELESHLYMLISPLWLILQNFEMKSSGMNEGGKRIQVEWREGKPVLASCLSPDGDRYEICEQSATECYLRATLANGTSWTYHLTDLPETIDLTESGIEFMIEASNSHVFFTLGSLVGTFHNQLVTWITLVEKPWRLKISPIKDDVLLLVCKNERLYYFDVAQHQPQAINIPSLDDACFLNDGSIIVLNENKRVTHLNMRSGEFEFSESNDLTKKYKYTDLVAGNTNRKFFALAGNKAVEYILPPRSD